MRKIDAVLLSALIIYDYSAQSLVDSDSSSLEQTFLSETTFQENKLADSYFADNLFAEGEENTVRSVKHIASTGNATEANTISYHELAKINSSPADNVAETVANNNVEETAALATAEKAPETSANAVEITMPDATAPIAETVETAVAEATNTEVENTITAAYTVATVDTRHQPAAADLSSFDTDGDGVFDYEDKCQGISGVARFEGCPVPDNDADGVNDEEDRCPVEAGAFENGGCPVATQVDVVATATSTETKDQKKNISRFTNLISFGFNGSVLSNEDFNIVLQFADVLIRQQEIKVEVSASKDNTNINYLLTYLKELGVQHKQVIVSQKDADVETDKTKVYMQLKL